jgi:hypothetical protein
MLRPDFFTIIKFYKNLSSRDKDHNSVQKQIIEEFVSLKNNFNIICPPFYVIELISFHSRSLGKSHF